MDTRFLTAGAATAGQGAFSATDIQAIVHLAGGQKVSLGNLHTLSISSHRDVFPVTKLTKVGAAGMTAGHRLVAGTLIFQTLDRNAFEWSFTPQRSYPEQDGFEPGVAHPDELPFFDIHVYYVNDRGDLSTEAVLGVRILDLGKSVSLEQIQPLESYSYQALEYVPMYNVIPHAPSLDQQFFLQPLRSRDRQPARTGLNLNLNDTLDPLLAAGQV